MKSTVIPAQVTTVEDRIAGNLSLTQILLLIAPVLLSTAIYALLPQKLAFSGYKIPLIILISILFVALAIRVKGRLALNWVGIIVTFLLRPHIYVFNKNSTASRDLSLFAPLKTQKRKAAKKEIQKSNQSTLDFDYRNLLRNKSLNVRFSKRRLVIAKNYD